MDNSDLNLLLILISKGDKIAFKKFFDAYYPGFINYSTSILKSKFMAEEIVSAVFINLWKNREDVTNIKNLNSYLYTTIKNRCYNVLRDQKTVLFDVFEDEVSKSRTELCNPESLFMDNELNQKIQQSINSLPPKSKMIFQMIKMDGLKYKEVAELLDISVKTVEVHMGRSVAKLRQALHHYVERPKIKLPFSKIATFIIASSFFHLF
jgi:RNA polymerase sigma-70 factor (ECF subfamily)